MEIGCHLTGAERCDHVVAVPRKTPIGSRLDLPEDNIARSRTFLVTGQEISLYHWPIQFQFDSVGTKIFPAVAWMLGPPKCSEPVPQRRPVVTCLNETISTRLRRSADQIEETVADILQFIRAITQAFLSLPTFCLPIRLKSFAELCKQSFAFCKPNHCEAKNLMLIDECVRKVSHHVTRMDFASRSHFRI